MGAESGMELGSKPAICRVCRGVTSTRAWVCSGAWWWPACTVLGRTFPV